MRKDRADGPTRAARNRGRAGRGQTRVEDKRRRSRLSVRVRADDPSPPVLSSPQLTGGGTRQPAAGYGRRTNRTASGTITARPRTAFAAKARDTPMLAGS